MGLGVWSNVLLNEGDSDLCSVLAALNRFGSYCFPKLLHKTSFLALGVLWVTWDGGVGKKNDLLFKPFDLMYQSFGSLSKTFLKSKPKTPPFGICKIDALGSRKKVMEVVLLDEGASDLETFLPYLDWIWSYRFPKLLHKIGFWPLGALSLTWDWILIIK